MSKMFNCKEIITLAVDFFCYEVYAFRIFQEEKKGISSLLAKRGKLHL